jgi:hypothetical protein
MSTWRQIQRERDSFEKGVINDIRKAMNTQVRQLKEAIGGMGYKLEDLDNVVDAIKDQPFAEAYKKTYGRVGGYFAKKTHSEIKATYPHLMHKARTEDEWIEMVRRSLSAAAAERVISVSQTSRERAKKMLKEILSEGFEQGLSIDKIAEGIDSKIDKAWKVEKKFRAVRIARTEIVAASNRGQLSGADATGLPMKKKWLASGSGEPRPEHLAMNSADPINKDEYFIVMGEQLLHPGDPSGSAANVINCRCTMTFAVI